MTITVNYRKYSLGRYLVRADFIATYYITNSSNDSGIIFRTFIEFLSVKPLESEVPSRKDDATGFEDRVR